MSKAMAIDSLVGLPGTLFYTLRARAEEQAHSRPLIQDPLAAIWYGKLSVPQAVKQAMVATYSPVFQLATAVRARLYDDIARNFIARHAAPQVVELGAGLSTRYHRLGDPAISWVELDLPEAVAVRRQVDEETAVHRFLAASMLDESWVWQVLETAVSPAHTLFIAEGVLFFLSRSQVRQLMNLLRANFPGALIAADVLTATYSPKTRSLFAQTATPIEWLVTDEEELANLGLQVEQSWVLTHQYLPRWEALGFSREKLQASRGNVLFSAVISPA